MPKHRLRSPITVAAAVIIAAAAITGVTSLALRTSPSAAAPEVVGAEAGGSGSAGGGSGLAMGGSSQAVALPVALGPGQTAADLTPGGSGALTPFLRFSGNGTVTVRPDQAVLFFSTDGRGDTQSAAVNQASGRMRRLINALKGAGVAADDLATDAGWAGRDWQSPGYTATQSVTVKVRDITKAAKLIALGIDNGATSSSGPSFTLSDPKSGYTAALQRAMADARSKADGAASFMNARVTAVVSVDEGQQSFRGFPMASAGSPKSPGDETAPPPVQPGTQEVTASVTVTFAYQPVK